MTDTPGEDVTLRQAALTAATGLLVMSVLSPLGFFYVFPRLVVRDHPAQTLQNIAAHQGLFLGGILCYLVTFIADIVVAWALAVFLAPVSASLSRLAAWFRVVYAAIALAALGKLATVLRLASAPDSLTVYGPVPLLAQAQMLLNSFRYEWSFAMLVFAVHLAMLGTLVVRSGHVPRLLGVLLGINAVGYAIDTLRPYLFPQVALPHLFLAFFGELIFMVWLFARGGRRSGAAGATAT